MAYSQGDASYEIEEVIFAPFSSPVQEIMEKATSIPEYDLMLDLKTNRTCDLVLVAQGCRFFMHKEVLWRSSRVLRQKIRGMSTSVGETNSLSVKTSEKSEKATTAAENTKWMTPGKCEQTDTTSGQTEEKANASERSEKATGKLEVTSVETSNESHWTATNATSEEAAVSGKSIKASTQEQTEKDATSEACGAMATSGEPETAAITSGKTKETKAISGTAAEKPKHSASAEKRDILVLGVPEADADTLNHFVKYLYTGLLSSKEVPLMKKLFLLASAYEVKCLKELCDCFLHVQLMTRRLQSKLLLASAYEAKCLKELCDCFLYVRHLQSLLPTGEPSLDKHIKEFLESDQKEDVNSRDWSL